MAKTDRRKRHRVLGWIAALSVSLVVALVVTFVWLYMRQSDVKPPQATPAPGAVPPTSEPTTPANRPAFQDASCPDVQLVLIPGTWESSPTDDPLNPTQFPIALLHNVQGPVAERGFGPERLQMYTVPYTAQFHNPFSTDGQMDYNDSRAEGYGATVRAMTDMNARCPLTSYVIVGFSQGAVIGGDIANSIGTGKGPVAEDLVLGVTLIADGRRETGQGVDVGPTPPGQGAEITLAEVPMMSSMGLTMTGPRPGGFGPLNNRVNQICAVGDLICNAPVKAFDITQLPETIEVLTGGGGQPVHALYATTQFWNFDGQSATQWAAQWAGNTIDGAPHPAHG